MKVCKRFKFDAAHRLPGYDGVCSRLHGHTWFLDVEVEGLVGKNGFVMDFMELKKLVSDKVITYLDHYCLNDSVPLGIVASNPTCENLLPWIWERLDGFGPPWKLSRLRLYESPDSYAEMCEGDV